MIRRRDKRNQIAAAAVLVLLLAVILSVMLAIWLADFDVAHAAQCGCPPLPEPPRVPQPLPPMQPGDGYVWLPMIAGGA